MILMGISHTYSVKEDNIGVTAQTQEQVQASTRLCCCPLWDTGPAVTTSDGSHCRVCLQE